MSVIQTILLGIIQGATEFLPISSSGHLVIVPYLLGWQIPPEEAFLFDVLVQVATLVAVFAYFWQDLVAIAAGWLRGLARRDPFADPHARLGWYLILASLPAGIAGLALERLVSQAFASPAATAISLLGTAALLLMAERLGRRRRSLEHLGWVDALWIGGFQALALFPGISRSGATITGGMSRDLERPTAARFSFLMSIPIMLAAGGAAGLDLIRMPNLAQLLPSFLLGFAAAALVGYFSIRWLLAFLGRRTLYGFSVYCALLSVLTLISLAAGR